MARDDILITLATQLAITDIRRYVLLKVGAWLMSIHVSTYGRRLKVTATVVTELQKTTKMCQIKRKIYSKMSIIGTMWHPTTTSIGIFNFEHSRNRPPSSWRPFLNKTPAFFSMKLKDLSFPHHFRQQLCNTGVIRTLIKKTRERRRT